ncbi:hypothetical protein [Cyanothece sp. BG0011]|uniref:hypothetical protein n=1 Tax=Cyanothece sp. BG0011 TaxID=2082950 RepID=UPI000D1E30A3|nr:hypothetical protein [Cyanothece sp. BG0011]
MTELPRFRVYPKKNCYSEPLKDLFNGCFYCDDYLPLSGDSNNPSHFVFVATFKYLDKSDIEKFCKAIKSSILYRDQDVDKFIYFVNFDYVQVVIDEDDQSVSLKQLKDLWQFKNHYKTVRSMEFDFDGKSTALIIDGLLNTLNFEPELHPSVEREVMLLATKLIREFTKDNKTVKRAYIEAFPSYLQDCAYHLLFNIN